MPIVKCDYFDKSLRPIDGGHGDLKLSFLEYAHALLSLHSGLGSKRMRAVKTLGYFLDILSNFKKQNGKLVMRNIPVDAYDGVKKLSDVYGAAMTVAIAQKIYKYRHVIPISPSMVGNKSGERPDFVAKNGDDYSLFESKASINNVEGNDKIAGIKQLNSVSYVKLEDGVIKEFSKKVLVATNFRHAVKTPSNQGVQCKIIDPDDTMDGLVQMDLSECLCDYYAFVKDVMKEGKEVFRDIICGHELEISNIDIGSHRITIGMLNSLAKFDWKKERPDVGEIARSLLDLPSDKTEAPLFADGVFVGGSVDFTEEGKIGNMGLSFNDFFGFEF